MSTPYTFLDRADVYSITSMTDGTKAYTVTLGTCYGYRNCTCPAFTYGGDRPCKHIRFVEGSLEDEGRPEVDLDPQARYLEVADLFKRALSWVDGDVDRASLLVEAYLKGRGQA